MRLRTLRPALTAAVATVLAATLTAAPTAPAYADHTDAPERVTLVGSLQSELGCTEDWAPACDQTALAPVDGGPVWEGTFEVPAGTWELKVTLDGTWDEAYGDGDGNLPLHLEHAATLRFSYDHESHRVALAPAELPSGEVTDADRELAGASLRTPLTRERFYFVMADRFANGDRSNDTGGLDGTRLEHGHDPADKGFFHGGDVAGLRKRLDYIEGLGTSAIWLTPSFANRPVQGAGENASAGYHGYWVTDFTRIDPHFGTNAELEAFIDEAHARGIKVFFDIITNHTADVIDYEEQQYGYVSKEAEPYRDASGQVFDDRDFAGTDDFPELDPATSFPYTPTFRSEADESVKKPEWLNDPTNYHNRGDSTFAGESSTYGDFVGLDDLFTEQPDVVDGMTEIYEAWVDFGIDGFRIDTTKHVNMEFWQEFAPAIREHAAAAGNPDFFAFGEVYDASAAFMSQYTTEGEMDATLDFGFQSVGTGFAKGGATTRLRDFYADDDWYTDGDSNAYSLPTFLGNHDMGRIGGFLDDDFSGEELLARDRLAHSLMYLTRGQPVVYYGDEQGFTGDGGDKDARQDMFASTVDSYNDDDLIGTDATTAAANFDPGHPLYRSIRRLSALRERHPALADGAQLHRHSSNEAGVYAFSRIQRGANREFLVAVNNASSAKTVSLRTLSPRGSMSRIWGSATQRVRADREGRVEVTVPALSAVVYRADARVPARDEAPAVHVEGPSAGGTVGGRAFISAGVPDGGFNQVTFGWRHAGSSGWTPLGTDDNAPYRVVHDVRDLADGTLLEYRAVLTDSSGNRSVASSYGVVGDPVTEPGDPGGGGPVTQPGAVSVPGSQNSEMGCPGDWQPGCSEAQLSLDAEDQVWKRTTTLPAGQYEYKAAIDGTWDENYGAGGAPNGGNVALDLAAGQEVTFYYDHGTHWVTSDANGPIVTAAGSFQSELGCPGDWAPDCLRSWLQDPDGDGTYTFTTDAIPAGSYEVKVTHGQTWDENYGQGGAAGGSNIAFDVPGGARVRFSYDLETHVLTVSTGVAGAAPDLSVERAQWLRDDLVAWDVPDADSRSHRLHWSRSGRLVPDAEDVAGGRSLRLTHDDAGLPADVLEDFPHLEGYEAFRLPAGRLDQVPSILRGQVAVASYDADGRLHDATGVQLPGVLDDVHAAAYDRELGPVWTRGRPRLSVWAPTAQDVDLLLGRRRVAMNRLDDGTWTVRGTRSWEGKPYRFEVRAWSPSADRVVTNTVTDPYSLALTADSRRSLVVDLDDRALTPRGWASTARPEVAQPEDRVVYELHVRDFSIGDDTVPEPERGTFEAFTERDSEGMTHLRELADAGLNTVHLLPVFDIATVTERRSEQATPPCDLASYGPASEEQQACIEEIRADDGFNWGYDPFHYTAPEGSYSTDPDGTRRTLEFRRMVQALHRDDLQVVMDVVYNHTAASGQDAKSVLDRVVPGYYQRLDAQGRVETSTCCANTASEHAMMEKLMIDSVLTWAREYGVDGFRFDLMGHHSLENMQRLREALDGLTVAEDGVDGSSIYVYGEGWNFGEVADDARFEQATQLNLAGTGIGSFSDRLRDAVRGGGPFDEDPRVQGLGSGLSTDPNGADVNGTAEEQAARLAHAEDLVKLGMAGNLADFEFASSETGGTVVGSEVDYNGQPAGYAADPSETVTYVDAHDNETLFDALQLKLPQETSMADRARMNTVSLSTVALGQGVAFWHAGTDLLRSKSLDRNSYDSGDWFNRIDWTGQENTFGSGLPPRADNEAKWDFMRPLLADGSLEPGPDAMAAARAQALDLLRIRSSSPLFRLGSYEQVQDKVSFLDAPDGVIVMQIDDTAGDDVDADRDAIVVVVNATPEAQRVAAGADGLVLHPVQAEGSDPVVKQTAVDGGTVTVPARTTAVLQR